MSLGGKFWGELPEQGNDYTPNVTADIERSMNKFFLSEFDSDDDYSPKIDHITLPPMDPLMLYAISLHKHANHLAELIEANKSIHEIDEETELKMPEMPDIYVRHTKNCLNYVPKEMTPFTMGCEYDIPELGGVVVRKIVTKCIATMFAQIGYETAQQSALDTMSDVVEEFFRKISHRLKVAEEDEEQRQMSGFPHSIERVLVEMGLGGIKGLNDYYQARVIKYITVLQNRCRKLHETLLKPKSPVPVDKINKLTRVKVEKEEVIEVENPEAHVATIGGDVSYSILETGYQLLNSLEAEINLQTLAETEDIPTAESPGVVESDMTHLSPFNKKKRYK